jgi:hypothetical protein
VSILESFERMMMMMKMIFIYCNMGLHPGAVVGKLEKNKRQHRRRNNTKNNTQNNTKTQNTQNRKQK